MKRDLHNDAELKGDAVRTFRSLTMRGSYLGQDRYDLQFAIKELASEDTNRRGYGQPQAPGALLKWKAQMCPNVQEAVTGE